MSLSRLLGKSPQEINSTPDKELEDLFSEKTTERNKNLGTPKTLSIAKPISIGIIAGSTLYLFSHFYR